jgi:hypothetical protein
MRWFLCLLVPLVFFASPAYAMDLYIGPYEYREVSYGKRVTFTVRLSNAVAPEYAVSVKFTYVNGMTSGALYKCYPDGTSCDHEYHPDFPVQSDDPRFPAVAKVEFFVLKQSGGGEPELIKTLNFNDVDLGGDPGGTDPGGTDPGGSDPSGGTDPRGSDPGSTDPGGSDPGDGSGSDGSGSCLCCQEVADMLGELKDSVDNSGYQLEGIQDVLDSLNDAVEQQGYVLEDMRGILADVSDKLDTANDHLSNISDQVTPKGSYDIDLPDWNSLLDQQQVPYVDQIGRVEDNNQYFVDPGEGDPVPPMPPQPDENYPVPIGKSYEREAPITSQPPLSPDLPKTSSPVKTPSPVMTPDAPKSVTPMQRDPVRQVDQMSRDPVRQKDSMQVDPVRNRTHIYQRQGVPSSP